MKWYDVAIDVFKVMPSLAISVLGAVKAVESPGNGTAKKEAVLGAVGMTYDAAVETAVAAGAKRPSAVVRAASMKVADGLTDLAVRLFNVVGW